VKAIRWHIDINKANNSQNRGVMESQAIKSKFSSSSAMAEGGILTLTILLNPTTWFSKDFWIAEK
jgi:hypothetical protein